MLVRRLTRAQKGAVLVEFAFSSLIMIMTLALTLEFGIEMFLREQTERAAGAAASTYALTRSPDGAQDSASEMMLPGFAGCLEPLDILLYDDISSLEEDGGRQATGGSSDDTADLARVSLSCQWTRMTPVSRMILGSTLTHEAVSYVRIR
jgi:hypothetical protein